ncbi:MAG: PAS domain S-box protein, partial [Methanosarcina sp.]|nr:PAS domain S-box protein [Methanosarcina sp.]
NGRILSVNPATCRVLGWAEEELIGRGREVMFNLEDPAVSDVLNELMRSGSIKAQLTYSRKDGTTFPGEISSAFFTDSNGEPRAVIIIRDITERKKTEESLQKAYDNLDEKVKERTAELEEAYKSLEKSEKGLAEAQKIAHIGNWDWNIITNKLYFSDEVYRIYGCEPQEFSVTRNVFLSYVHPDDRDYVDNSFNKSLNEKPISIDYRIILPNKEERVIHAQGEVIFNDENIPFRTIGTIQDITERIKSEEKNQILANIVESSNDAIGTISLDSIITSWNKGAEQVYGYLAEEILGKPISILVPPHLEKEPQKLSELIKRGEGIPRYETLRLRKDGKIIYVSITLSPVFDIHGKLTAISFISRDITESRRADEKLRESEVKYRNIVETANEGILITDNGAIITYANKKLADMLGCTLEEVIGRPTWGFINEEYKPIVKLNLEKRRQGISESYELKLICKDGSPLWTLLNAKPLFDEDGMFIGVMNMLTDIDKRKRAEEALVKIEIARKKEIHHRIKNNLQVISSLLDLQAEKFSEKEVLEAFRESQSRVLSMSLIHEELYKGGGTDTVDFSAYLQKLAENLFKTYSLCSKNIHLYMDLEEYAFFNMDTAVPLGIIVNELISNSLKHAFTEKEGEIRIRLCREEKKNEISKSLFSLTISDNGKGIPENIELGSVESLGLQLVSILVDQLDGKIELIRNHGTESRITFRVTEKSEIL